MGSSGCWSFRHSGEIYSLKCPERGCDEYQKNHVHFRVGFHVLRRDPSDPITFPGWTKASTTSTNDVLQRLEDLEVVQEDNDKSFFLVDTSLNDLDARVLELEKITEAQARQIDALTKRYGRLFEAIR